MFVHYVTLLAQILKGSHKVGRIEHNRVGGQTGADVERVEEIMKVWSLAAHTNLQLLLC